MSEETSVDAHNCSEEEEKGKNAATDQAQDADADASAGGEGEGEEEALDEAFGIPIPPNFNDIQFYVPQGNVEEAQLFLERHDELTEEDVLNFVYGRPVRPPPKREGEELQKKLVRAYHRRRDDILDLATKYWKNEAYIDEDGRLVPMPENEEGDPAPEPNGDANNNNNGGDNNDDNNDNDNNDMAINNLLNNNIPFPLDQEEEQRRWTEQEERAAEEAIARAVERYRAQGVPEEDFVLLRVPPPERPERASLTFRRICFAVLAVVTAFICIMLQSLPLFPRNNQPNPLFDKLLYELLEVRHFPEHAQACPGLHRTPTVYEPWWSSSRFWMFWEKNNNNNTSIKRDNNPQEEVDCGDGVLHIPTKTVLVDSFFESSTQGDPTFWEPYVLGVNVSWFMPCNPARNIAHCQSQEEDSCRAEDSCGAEDSSSSNRQQPQDDQLRCFRGIHDNVITDQEVGDAVRLGADLIQGGGDHFDVHYKPQLLQERLPSMLQTIRGVLQDTYFVGGKMEPVAFRVSAVGPLDGNGVALRGSHGQTSNYLLRILNRSNYIRWIEKYKRHNELARYALPWPTRRKPFRDPCRLMADMEADPRFAFHTTVFLSNGAGRDFRGGVSLYVDDHPSNANPRRKIQRGVTIDGSRGRLVVSTGGLENRRCRMPTREGVRAALQIWWSCNPADSSSCAAA